MHEKKKHNNRKTSKHRRISVDICHFYFLSASLLLLFDHFVYMKQNKNVEKKWYIHCFTHTHTHNHQVATTTTTIQNNLNRKNGMREDSE